MLNGKVNKVWDNSENGKPSYCLELNDGQKLYINEHISVKDNDDISYSPIATKTSKSGNQYTTISGVTVVGQQPQHIQSDYPHAPIPEPVRTALPNDPNRNIFVTGVVGRSMGSGNFQIQDIDSLTAMAMATYKKYFI